VLMFNTSRIQELFQPKMSLFVKFLRRVCVLNSKDIICIVFKAGKVIEIH
jgi:hypothetical protein